MSDLVITKTQRHGILGAATVLLLALVVAVGSAGSGGQTGTASELPSQSFELFDGGEATFADFDDQPLVINFWASWCPACVAELPEFQEAHDQRRDDVTFLGMANADIREAALRLADDVGLTYTLADDPRGDLFRSFDLIAMPSTVFVTADGQIHEVFGGQLTASALDERIDELVEASS